MKEFKSKGISLENMVGADWKRRVSLTPSGTRDLTPRA